MFIKQISFKKLVIWIVFCISQVTTVASAIGPSVTMSSTDFSFQNLVFKNLFEFPAAEIT